MGPPVAWDVEIRWDQSGLWLLFREVCGESSQVHLLSDQPGLHFNLITNHKSMKETTITNYVCQPPLRGCCHLAAGCWYYLYYPWWWMVTRPGTRARAPSRCWSPSQSGSSGSASSLITECRATFLSRFCHHMWWWSPVTLHTIHRQHAGESHSLGPKLRSEYRRSSWKCMFQFINITIIKIKEVWAVHMVCGLIFVTVGAWSYSGTKALQWDLKIYCSESNTRDRVQPRNPDLAFYEAECRGIDKALDSRHAIRVFRPSSCPNTTARHTRIDNSNSKQWDCYSGFTTA